MKKTLWSSIAALWCRLTHPAPMWPVHGHYRCPACWRQYPVPWEAAPFGVAAETSDVLQMSGERIVRPAHSW